MGGSNERCHFLSDDFDVDSGFALLSFFVADSLPESLLPSDSVFELDEPALFFA
jgi:hypothetical protein